MVANRLHFQKQSDVSPVASTLPGDVAVGIRGNDFISIPVSMLGNVPVRDWDAAASESNVPLEVIPYLRTGSLNDPMWAVPPTTNIAKTSLKKAAATAGDFKVAGQLAGHLPSTGKYWFVVFTDAGVMDTSNVNWVEVNFSRDPAYLSPSTTAFISGLGFGYDYGWLDSQNFTDTLTGVRKYLVCVDIDAGKIDVYASTGLTATVTIPPYNGNPALANAFVNFAMFMEDGAAGELFFSVTGTDTPYAIPGGYSPLVTRETDVAVPAGRLNLATSASALRDYKIQSGTGYFVDKDGGVFEIPVSSNLAKLSDINSFKERQTFVKGFQFDNGVTAQANGSSIALTAGTNPVNGRLVADPNIVIGRTELSAATSGDYNVAIGVGIGALATQVEDSVLLGYGLNSATDIVSGVAIGRQVGNQVAKLASTVLVGPLAGDLSGYELNYCTAIGASAMSGWGMDPLPGGLPTVVTGNVAIGSYAWGIGGKPGSYNTILGYNSVTYNATGTYGPGVVEDNVVLGAYALAGRQGDNSKNVVLGRDAMIAAGDASENVILGYQAAGGLVGNTNVAVGALALKNDTPGANTNSNCTAIGNRSMRNLSGTTNSTAIGANATVTGSNQVQLGDSSTTTYAYGAVQNRSDARDKREVRNTILGLSFLLKLRPVDFKLDLREDYIDYDTRPAPPPALRPEPQLPAIEHTEPGYQEALIAYSDDHLMWEVEKDDYETAYAKWQKAAAAWDQANSMANIVTDGSKMRNRFHHGLIAQEVHAAAESMGVDFGGYQDHSLNGGQDVRSLGYEELIAPTIRAIQELHAYVHSDEFEERIAAKVLDKMLAARSA